MNKTMLHTLLAILLIGIAYPSKAQVTIGSGVVPRTGTVLDLKQDNKTGADANSIKGLGLPRVKLVDKNTFLTSENNPTAITAHDGVMVYNIDPTLDGAGVYTWDGTQWINNSRGTGGAVGGSTTAEFTLTIAPTAEKNGSFTRGQTVAWNRVRQQVEVNVTKPGAYHITTNKINGVQWEASGLFENAGTVTLDLIASGTPLNGGTMEHNIVQPSNSIAQKTSWVALDNLGTGNTGLFGYKVSAMSQSVNEGQTITVDLDHVMGTEPANKTVKWFVDNVEVTSVPNAAGVTAMTDTQIQLTRNGASIASVSAMVVDNDNADRYMVSNTLRLQWRIPWVWGSGGVYKDNMVYWEFQGLLVDAESVMPPSEYYCKEKYGISATLSTYTEMMMTEPNVTVREILKKTYASNGPIVATSAGVVTINVLFHVKNEAVADMPANIQMTQNKSIITIANVDNIVLTIHLPTGEKDAHLDTDILKSTAMRSLSVLIPMLKPTDRYIDVPNALKKMETYKTAYQNGELIWFRHNFDTHYLLNTLWGMPAKAPYAQTNLGNIRAMWPNPLKPYIGPSTDEHVIVVNTFGCSIPILIDTTN